MLLQLYDNVMRQFKTCINAVTIFTATMNWLELTESKTQMENALFEWPF